MAWSASDFAFAGVLLFVLGAAFALVARKTANGAYRAAVGVAVAAAFILVWVTAQERTPAGVPEPR